MNLVVVYLASPRSWGWLKWSRIDCLEASLKLLRRNAGSFPVIIFHEDYELDDMKRLWTSYPNIKFVQVDFSTHQDRYKPGYREARIGTYGYGMMCRFFSGVMQAHPALNGFTHYMRLDDDSYILSPMTEAVMARIADNDYTYRCTFEDPQGHRELWDHTLQFLRDHQIPISPKANYCPTAPYTNYHTSSLRLWQHPAVKAYVESIEACDGCITKGWDDALIQGTICRLLCPATGHRVHVEDGFCYRHNQHCSHRPGHAHGPLCLDGNEAHHHGDINYQWGPPILC